MQTKLVLVTVAHPETGQTAVARFELPATPLAAGLDEFYLLSIETRALPPLDVEATR